MNRKERRKGISPYRIQTPFEHVKGKDDTPQVRYVDNADGRRTAIITLKGYASTRIKDADGDVIDPSVIDLTRFREGNMPLKAQHGRGIHTNIGIITSLIPDEYGLYMEAETRLDVSKDAHGRPLNQDDYVVYDRLMNKSVTGFSIGFHNITWEYNETEDEYTMIALTLHEVSVVDVSSNPMTAIKFYEKAYEALLQSLSTMKKTKKTITISNDVEEKDVDAVGEEEVTEEVTDGETIEEKATEEGKDIEEEEDVENQEEEKTEEVTSEEKAEENLDSEDEVEDKSEEEKTITDTTEKDVATTQEDDGDVATGEETSENEEKSLSEEGMRDTIVKAASVIKELQTELARERELRTKAEKRVQKLEGLKVKAGILKTTPKEPEGEVAKAFKNAGITF